MLLKDSINNITCKKVSINKTVQERATSVTNGQKRASLINFGSFGSTSVNFGQKREIDKMINIKFAKQNGILEFFYNKTQNTF